MTTEISNIPQLLNMHGKMYLNPEDALICFYPEGDMDLIDAETPNEDNLRRALYACREVGELPSDCKEVYLPNGRLFSIDAAPDQQFIAYWEEGSFITRRHSVETIAFFSEDNCYSSEDRAAIHALHVGQVWIAPDYGMNHTVTRIA